MSQPANEHSKLASLSRRGGHLVAELKSPSIGQHEAPRIAEQVSAAIAEGSGTGKCFVLDLSGVGMLASMGLGMCVDLRNRAVDQGYKPVLFGLNQYLADLMKMMRVERLFTVASTKAELERLLS